MALNYLNKELKGPVTKPTGHEPLATHVNKLLSGAMNYHGMPVPVDSRPTFSGAAGGPKAMVTKPTEHKPAFVSGIPLPFHTVVYNANARHVPDLESVGVEVARRRAEIRMQAAKDAYVPVAQPIALLHEGNISSLESRLLEKRNQLTRTGLTSAQVDMLVEDDLREIRAAKIAYEEAKAGITPRSENINRVMTKHMTGGASEAELAARMETGLTARPYSAYMALSTSHLIASAHPSAPASVLARPPPTLPGVFTPAPAEKAASLGVGAIAGIAGTASTPHPLSETGAVFLDAPGTTTADLEAARNAGKRSRTDFEYGRGYGDARPRIEWNTGLDTSNFSYYTMPESDATASATDTPVARAPSDPLQELRVGPAAPEAKMTNALAHWRALMAAKAALTPNQHTLASSVDITPTSVARRLAYEQAEVGSDATKEMIGETHGANAAANILTPTPEGGRGAGAGAGAAAAMSAGPSTYVTVPPPPKSKVDVSNLPASASRAGREVFKRRMIKDFNEAHAAAPFGHLTWDKATPAHKQQWTDVYTQALLDERARRRMATPG